MRWSAGAAVRYLFVNVIFTIRNTNEPGYIIEEQQWEICQGHCPPGHAVALVAVHH